MQKAMQKPVNWQDFEQLCKRLWGEEWDCSSSIKRNGRAGQAQHGVDIYCLSEGSKQYRGFQCKGKDDYSNATLTETEIDEEVEKAKTFKPNLELLIFATSGNKDAKIEQYIREKNVQMLSEGFFSVDIFSWEDIVDLIESNKSTYAWYLRNVLHDDNYKIDFHINGEDKYVIFNPVFVKNIINVAHQPIRHVSLAVESMLRQQEALTRFITPQVFAYALQEYTELDYTIVKITMDFFNTGDAALDNYKLIITFETEKIELVESNIKKSGGIAFAFLNKAISNYFIDGNQVIYTFHPDRPVLVPQDGKQITVFAKLPAEIFEFRISYRILSRNYSGAGIVNCKVEPVYEITETNRPPEDGEEERIYETVLPKKERRNTRS